MQIVKPSDAELAALMAEHAHRRPEKGLLRVLGDGDQVVQLPIVVGNPSGACKMPRPEDATTAWDQLAAGTFNLRTDDDGLTEKIAADAVLWPPPATWAAWCQRWAALPNLVQGLVRRKVGAARAQLERPEVSTPRPPAVAALLERHAGAVWRRLLPQGAEPLDVVLTPPDSGVWRLFNTAFRKRDAKHGALLRDMVGASVLAALRADGSPMDPDELFDRWPGFVLTLSLHVHELAGLLASADLGEW
jgi:hypothetical protein